MTGRGHAGNRHQNCSHVRDRIHVKIRDRDRDHDNGEFIISSMTFERSHYFLYGKHHFH